MIVESRGLSRHDGAIKERGHYWLAADAEWVEAVFIDDEKGRFYRIATPDAKKMSALYMNGPIPD